MRYYERKQKKWINIKIEQRQKSVAERLLNASQVIHISITLMQNFKTEKSDLYSELTLNFMQLNCYENVIERAA